MQAEIILSGRVQGVNFRRRLANLALEKKITGSVENLSDGRVHIFLQGTKSEINESIDWIERDPLPARISEMNVKWQDNYIKQSDFTLIKNGNIIKDQFHAIRNLGSSLLGSKNDKITVPLHIAIIPDGNRRWAKSRGMALTEGHKFGADFERLFRLFKYAKSQGVKYVTLWGFSTENWKRSQFEVQGIMSLLSNMLITQGKVLIDEGIRLIVGGRKDRLSPSILVKLEELVKNTASNSGLVIQFLIDYGGRDEIVRGVNQVIKSGVKSVDEESFKNYLEASRSPEPDLIIRTGGERRLSGLLPYQSIYSELYFTEVYFPDFDSEQLKLALEDYSTRKRRFGK